MALRASTYVIGHGRGSTHGPDVGAEDDWRHRGACGNGTYNPDLWTSPTNSDLGQARWVCLRECPVQQQCAAWALKHPEQAEGAVYGGYYYAIGRAGRDHGPAGVQPVIVQPGTMPTLVRVGQTSPGSGQARQSVCGTVAGYKSHIRERTAPCGPCLEANRDSVRAYRRAS